MLLSRSLAKDTPTFLMSSIDSIPPIHLEVTGLRLSVVKAALEQYPNHQLTLVLPDGDVVPVHFHVTEVGRIDKTFVDCGGTPRSLSLCSLQVWTADDLDHRLPPGKLARIIDLAAPILRGDDLPVEVEYEDCSISQFPVLAIREGNGVLTLELGEKHTGCMAMDVCFPPAGKASTGAASGSGCCTPGGGCC